jgi:RND family efflux transporter MFP subunit
MKRTRSALIAALLSVAPAAAAGFDATLGFARRVELGLTVSGVVASVDAEVGARVKKDQVLVALQEVPFQAAVERAQGQVTRASADREEAQRDHKHMQEIYDRQLASTTELDNARLRLKRADGALEQARATLTRARFDLARSRIRAPFDAWVLETRVTAGQSVVSTVEARPLVILAAAGEYAALARVAGATVDVLKVGQPATVTVAGKRYAARVKSIVLEPVAGQASSEPLYSVVVSFESADALRAGQTVRVDLP